MEPSENRELETRVTPGGSDLPGRLKVVAPGVPSGETRIAVLSTSPYLAGALGEEMGPHRVGAANYRLTSGGFYTDGTAQIAANQLTTVQVGLFAVDLKNAPPTLGLRNYASAAAPNPRIYRSAGDSQAIATTSDGTYYWGVVPGSYYLEYGMIDGVPIDVAASETKRFKGWEYAGRRVAKIIAPVRELPTASCAQGGGSLAVPKYSLTAYHPSLGSRYDYLSLADGETVEVGAAAKHASQGYTLTITGVSGSFSLPLGATGAGPQAFPIGRLDVDDVRVTQADGSVKIVRGTYAAYLKTGVDSSGNEVFAYSNSLNCTPDTNTGVDLIRGRYKVVVAYPTVEQGTKYSNIVVDVE
ncbi:hypothetical protein [Pendulispora albinea]|uniref:Uncharacterized protein n=1 Tax=Pendulispora albinea TaxID=2741071 RepID=A0ABZ2M6F6_9BACT